jgi:CubicO group peptidase (beta-lactamase class C family)
LRVATNYSAKMVCSSVFISGRDAEQVLAVDVQAPGHPLLRQVSIDVDRVAGTIEARLFGYFAPAKSQYRPGLGCTNVHKAPLSDASLLPAGDLEAALWPTGNVVMASQDPQLATILGDEALLGDGYRAVVVVRNGRIVAEVYGDRFDADTPLLGWSMTKTVTAALIGTMVQSGQIALDDRLSDVFSDWANDDRRDISVQDMLAMSSGLSWNEGYGNVSDVTRMLYLEDDMATFAASLPLEANVGAVFNYSSGTTTALSHVWQSKLGDGALTYPTQALFAPLGMTSAILETDATDTFVGSSYMYATGRDWARFGQLLLQEGAWDGRQILPTGYTDWMVEPVAASDRTYGRGQIWHTPPGDLSQFEDAVWLRGHDGQSIGIFPSHDMVLVRLGLTPSRDNYSSLPLAQALIAALDE